jgi:SNF2 family DNA or RNA helicase
MLRYEDLTPDQRRGINFIFNRPFSALVPEPGSGKTVIMLTALKMLKQTGLLDKKVLLIAPIEVCNTVWENEANKTWSHLAGNFTFVNLVGLSKVERHKQLMLDADIYMINPESLKSLYGIARGDFGKFGTLIYDESTKSKNPKAKNTRILHKIAPQFTRRHIMSGGPKPNSLQDLWAQYYIVDLGRSLGSFITHFRRDYMRPEYGGWTASKNDIIEVAKKVAPITFHIKNSLNLPTILPPDIVLFDLPEEAKKLYDEVVKGMIKAMGDIRPERIILSSMEMRQKCSQICSGYLYTDVKRGLYEVIHHEKEKQLLDYVCRDNDRFIISYNHRSEADRLRQVLPNSLNLTVMRKTLTAQAVIDMWQNPSYRFMVVNPQSAGHGINRLDTNTRRFIRYSIDYSREKEEQFIGRIRRASSTHDTIKGCYLLARGTIEEKVYMPCLREKEYNQELFKKLLVGYLEENR